MLPVSLVTQSVGTQGGLTVSPRSGLDEKKKKHERFSSKILNIFISIKYLT